MSARSLRAAGAALTALAAGGATAFAYGSLVERRAFTLREVTVPVLPTGSDSIRVLHLSDLHMAPWQHDKQQWIRSLARFEPDLIVDTGDNLSHQDGLSGIRAALDVFRGVPGVFVHGSNDYFGPQLKNPFKYFTGPSKKRGSTSPRLDTAALTEYLSGLGWLDLNNATGALEVRGTHLELFGVDDPHIRYDRVAAIPGALDELRENDPYSDDTAWPGDGARPERPTVTLGVVHAPYRRVLDSFVTYGAAMIFAGHTHGGQVCVPGYGALVTNCDISRKQAKGLSLWRHAFRTAYLNVSAGLGTSIYAPVRFACRPEATLVTLTAAE
ncbi:phosphohydrolase [Leifsonia xyli subsp. cynodontis DSM 46306]|uniref:Calcineurin-like phosphoesterase domain-containing protein n=1 Tax=Leifsonia xyli subsp. cynodontis DSM 46306 TaxID=1389489 RepID=U3P7Q3_LEIXC|nr:metallophosphoesterase [Leifsonia xyli]AGW42335.1 phosphohydrolase [Leifsonia xyli subsp. cynodontis DSM 46306]